jgi:hypothetical protein
MVLAMNNVYIPQYHQPVGLGNANVVLMVRQELNYYALQVNVRLQQYFFYDLSQSLKLLVLGKISGIHNPPGARICLSATASKPTLPSILSFFPRVKFWNVTI